jgi:hypothetical protein
MLNELLKGMVHFESAFLGWNICLNGTSLIKNVKIERPKSYLCIPLQELHVTVLPP